MLKKIYVLALCLLLSLPKILAQNINGQVLEIQESTERPIPGANIYWANTSLGTSTDTKGNFSILKTHKTNLLVISFIGYKSDTLEISKENNYYKIILRQNKELEEVVIKKRGPGSHISRANPIMTININSNELSKAACCNLSESFETNPSIDVGFSDAITGAKQIRLLGLKSNYIQIMTENFPNFYGLGRMFGLGYVPGPWMESIQISKGTSSVKNGYEALTGQINVEYKKPKNSEKFYLNLFANDIGKTEANASSSLSLNNKLSTIVLAHAENMQQENDHNNDGFLDAPKTKQLNLMNRWDYFGKQATIRTGIKLLTENKNGGQTSSTKNKNALSLFKIDIETKRFEAFSKTGYSFRDKQKSSIGWINNFIYHKQKSTYGTNIYKGTQRSFYSNLIFESKIFNQKHKYSTGLSLKQDYFQEALNTNEDTRKESVPGIFLEYTYTPFSKLTILAGIRSDFHSQYGAFITPRIHFKYDINKQLKLRGAAGKGYRSPQVLAENIYLLASSKKFEIKQGIKQEEAWNFGTNLTKYIQIRGKELSLSTEYYHTHFIHQLIVDMETDPSKVLFYDLDGKSFANNYQIQASYELFRGLETTVAFRYSDVQTSINGQLLKKALVSQYKGLVTTSYITPLEKWQFDFTTQFNGGGRYPSSPVTNKKNTHDSHFSPYIIINSQITKRFRLWEIYLGIENATNFVQKQPIISAENPKSIYFDATKIWGPLHGRKFYIGIRLSIEKNLTYN